MITRHLPTALVALPMLVACRTVQVPETSFYRLATERPAPAALLVSERTLRVEDLSVSPHLTGDALLAVVPPHRVEPRRYHAWAAPLDQLVTDAVLQRLLASGGFRAVVDARERGEADWTLSGRVLRFEQVAEEGAWYGLVALSLGLRDECSGQLLWQGRLHARVPARGPAPEDGVAALDVALAQALQQLPVLSGDEVALSLESESSARTSGR